MGGYPSGSRGRAHVDSRRPDAYAVCDRCGFQYNKAALAWQYEGRGDKLQNLRILVCDRCNDVPQEQRFKFPGGLADYLTQIVNGRETLTPTPFAGEHYCGKDGAVEWAIAWPVDCD